MTQFQIKKAVRHQKKGRVILTGPSGSGKTWGALVIAHVLAGDGRVGVIDTENGSAEMFAGEYSADLGKPFNFDVLELNPPYSPERYIEAFEAMVAAGYDAIVVDSTTHEWDGPGGCLEIHDDEAGRTRDKFRAWGIVTPRHKAFLDRVVVRSPVHIVGTARAKTEYATSKDEQGKMKVEKLGTGPIQRAQFEFEWDVLCDLSLDHTLYVTKSRVLPVDGKTYRKDLKPFAEALRDWLAGGEAQEPTPADADLKALAALGDPKEIKARSEEMFGKGPRDLTMTQYNQLKGEFAK